MIVGSSDRVLVVYPKKLRSPAGGTAKEAEGATSPSLSLVLPSSTSAASPDGDITSASELTCPS